MVSCKCAFCGDPMLVRAADRKRGWGRFCSKSCKAREQTKCTGYAGPQSGTSDYDDRGWDSHKDNY